MRAAAWLVPLGVLVNVGVTLLTTDFHYLREVGRVSLVWVLLAVGLALVPWVTQSLRIGLWTRFVGHPISFLGGIRIAAGGVLGSAVTPTAVGGGTIRWALATRQGLPAGKAASLLTVEAVEDLLFFAVAIPVAGALSKASGFDALDRASRSPGAGVGTPVVAGLAVVIGGALLAAVLWRLAVRRRLGARARRRALRLAARARQPVRKTVRDIRAVTAMVARRGKRRFAVSLSLTGIQWIARYSLATLVIVLLGGPLRPFLYWVLGWLTVAASSAVPTPGAAGAAEATFYVLHAPFVPAEMLVVATAAWRLLIFYVPALVAVVVFPLLGRLGADVGADEPRAENGSAAPGLEALPVPSASPEPSLIDG